MADMENQRDNPLKANLPADWAQHAPTGSNAELRARYGVGDKVLARWRKESGIPAPGTANKDGRASFPLPDDFAQFAGTMKNAELAVKYGVGEKVISRWRKESGIQSPAANPLGKVYLPRPKAPSQPIGFAAEAVRFLQEKGYRPVYHREIEGREFRGQYVVGHNKMSEDDLIAYARTRGFKTGSERLASLFAKYD